jgi:hypothetical protein
VVVVSCIVVVVTCFVMCECVDVWVCVFVGFLICVSFGNTCTCIYCVLYCLYCDFCIVSFMYMFSYLFRLYCHRVTTQLQLVIIIIIIIIIYWRPIMQWIVSPYRVILAKNSGQCAVNFCQLLVFVIT